MSWDSTLPIIFRSVIGDNSDTPKYTDDSINQLLLTAAQFVVFRVRMPQTYAIDVENVSLTPDPTDATTRDDAFINLTVLKGACMLLNAEVRLYGQQAISIRDGTSAIDLKRNLKDLQSLADTYCKELEKAIYQYYSTQMIPGEAVIGPHKTLLGGLEGYYHNPRTCRW